VNIPTDVQNQLIKFLGLDSFGIFIDIVSKCLIY